MSTIAAITYDGIVAVTAVASGNIFQDAAAGFFVNVAGNIQIIDSQGKTNTLTVLAGIIYPIAIKSILSGGTTATGIYALIAAPHKGST